MRIARYIMSLCCEKRQCKSGGIGLRREPEDLSVQTEVTTAVCTHRRDGSTARGQTRRSSLREMLRPRHSTTAIPGTTLLLHPQLTKEAWAWSANARDPGNGQAAHNPKVGVPKEAGHIRPSGGGRRLRVAQSGMGTTPQRLGGIDRITDGTGRRNPVGIEIGSLAGAHRAHSRCLATGGLEAALAKAMKGKTVSQLGGHLRGRMTRAGGKADERIIDTQIDGGCTLSRETVAMKSYQQRTPDSSGGIKSSTDRYPNQCDCRPGGVLSSGMARIGAKGRAGTSGEAGPPIFESIPRPLAAAGMLPQGRLAGEHARSFCFYVIGLDYLCMTETIVAQDRYLDRFCVRMVAERIPGKAF